MFNISRQMSQPGHMPRGSGIERGTAKYSNLARCETALELEAL